MAVMVAGGGPSRLAFRTRHLVLRALRPRATAVPGPAPRVRCASSGTAPPLAHEVDRFGGILVASDGLPPDPAEFGARLASSMAGWRAEGRRGLWLKLPAERAALLPAALAQGLELHHAEKGYVMCNAWLPEGEGPSPLPANASHQVGVGAFVLNRAGDRVLMVCERHGPASGKRDGQDLWKLPTGLLAAGEDIAAGAEREVEEETGVRAEFQSVVGVRHAHGAAFGKSDLYFLCALRLREGATEDIRMQDSELRGARWSTLADFVDNPAVRKESYVARLNAACADFMQGHYAGLAAETWARGTSSTGDVTVFTAVGLSHLPPPHGRGQGRG